MALSAGMVSIGVKPDTRGFGSTLRSGIMGESSGLPSLGKVLGGALLGGIGVAVAGIGAVIATGFGEAMDASAGSAQLAAGIKSTGNAAKVSVEGLNDLASSIQGYSGQTDDSIVASEKLLLTFTNIKNNGPDKIFDLATKATADMAAKLGGDASGAAIQLGKALNDPIKGVSALARVGVSFTDAQKNTIAAMVKTGDTAGAQKVILKELQVEFGGAAKAAGDSLPGQMAKGKRAFEDLSQTIVEGAAPAVGKISDAITNNVLPAIKSFTTGFKNGTGAGGEFKDILGKVGSSLVAVGGFLKDHTGLVKAAAVAIGLGVVAVKAYQVAQAISLVMLKAQTLGTIEYSVVQGIASVATKAWAVAQGIVNLATKAWAVTQGLLNAALIANPIGLVVVAVGLLIAGIVLIATKTTWFQTAWKVMTDALGAAWQWLWNTILAPIIRFVLGGFASITDGIASMLKTLSNIPGFGWAKTAADKMAGAADKARALAAGIRDIPDRKNVMINVDGNFSASALRALSLTPDRGGKRIGLGGALPGNAAGTDNWRGGPTWVGERGPEIVNLPKGAQVIPNHHLGGAGGNGADVVGAIRSLEATFRDELNKQARTIQTMQRQMA